MTADTDLPCLMRCSENGIGRAAELTTLKADEAGAKIRRVGIRVCGVAG